MGSETTISRRAFLRLAGVTMSGAALVACTRTTASTNVPEASATEGTPVAEGSHELGAVPTLRPQESMESSEALIRLLEGNGRYVEFNLEHPDQTEERRVQVASGQTPFAVIVGCADSRVPPEILFDQGLGDLFVVRVAGNIVDSALMGSIEYAVEHLGAKLIMVLGHERCGAVKATIDTLEAGTEAPGSIGTLVEALRPAVELAQDMEGDLLDNAVTTNVILTVNQVKTTSPILSEAMAAGELIVVGGRYDLDTGAVKLMLS